MILPNDQDTVMAYMRISLIGISISFFVLIIFLGRSIVRKQDEESYAKTTSMDNVIGQGKREMFIKKIWIYPLKSGRRMEVKNVEIREDGCGLKYDRMFMVVNNKGEMVSQRKVRAMASIETRIEAKKGVAVFSAPGMKSDLTLNLKKTNEVEVVKTKIWRVDVQGLDCGKTASDWITTYLNLNKKKSNKEKNSFRILRIDAPISRHKDPKYSPMLRSEVRNLHTVPQSSHSLTHSLTLQISQTPYIRISTCFMMDVTCFSQMNAQQWTFVMRLIREFRKSIEVHI